MGVPQQAADAAVAKVEQAGKQKRAAEIARQFAEDLQRRARAGERVVVLKRADARGVTSCTADQVEGLAI